MSNTNTNTIFDRALRDHRERRPSDDPDPTVAAVKQDQTVGSETYAVSESATTQPRDESSWSTGMQEYGIPRGTAAWEAHELGSTAAMEIVKNTITDQVTGGDPAFPSEEETLPDEVVALQDMFGEILTGPHLLDDDLDDLITAAVSDMIDLGEAFWETLAADGAEQELPVLALKPVDALTMRVNVDEHGNWPSGSDDGDEDNANNAAYYQAPYQSYHGETVAMGDTTPTGLSRSDVVHLRWSGSRRSDRVYPLSPTMQVKQWLDLLSNTTTHLNRFYNDNEIPAGLLSVLEGTETDVETIADKIEEASGDPRTAPVVGTEAKWIEMGGTAIDLNVIEESKWFLQLCWGSVGLNKNEIGLIEDVNRNTASEQSSVIYKRVTLPTTKTIEQAVNRQILPQFEVYNALDQPFRFALNRSDPERERAKEKLLLQRYNDGAISYAEYRRQIGEDPEQTVVTLPNGETFDYGPHPKNVAEILINAYKSSGGGSDPDDPVDGDSSDDPPGDSGEDDGDG